MVETHHDGIDVRTVNRYDGKESSIINDAISVEAALRIIVEHRGEVTLFSTTLCTPQDLEDLVIGLLWSEGVDTTGQGENTLLDFHSLNHIRNILNGQCDGCPRYFS